MEESMVNKLSKSAKEIITKIEELIKEGNLRRIIIKDDNGEVFIEIPMLVGAIVTLAAPLVSAIGVIAGFATNFSVEIIKKDNSKIILLSENNNPDK
jgi:Domain of unknown function (DUF4342)